MRKPLNPCYFYDKMSKFSSHFERCWKPACAVLYFIFFQVLLGMLPLVFSWPLSQAMIVIFSTMFSGMLTVIVLVHFGYVHIGQFRTALTSKLLLLFMLLQLLASMGVNVLEEYCELPDSLSEIMPAVVANPLGILSVAVIAPIAEELTFRGGLMGGLMKNGYSAKTAIWASAITFGLIHMNPVQIVFGAIMGVLLGWAYWRTRSLLPCILMHLANNSFAVLASYICDDPQGRITEELGLWPALCVMVVCLVAAFYLYRYLDNRLKKS
ncbi:MAG: CPBP family intramembrane metalloprotease [Bacteroidaceae bacterium]|nr:CPBP family intramembrane metalloprotease [Bacteroidaceae bacterium]